MSDLYAINLVEKYNQALADRGVTSMRWRWRNPKDWDAGMELYSVFKPASKLEGIG
jgi:hypothetical protein